MNKTNDYLNMIISQGFLPLITKPTRICRTASTLIDHMYCNKITCTAGIVITDVADHYGTLLQIPITLSKCKQKEKCHLINKKQY